MVAAALGLWFSVGSAATTARADVSLTFDQTSYSASIGDTLNVTVFLHQTTPLGAGEPDLATWGLLTAGIEVMFPNTLQLTAITTPL